MLQQAVGVQEDPPAASVHRVLLGVDQVLVQRIQRREHSGTVGAFLAFHSHREPFGALAVSSLNGLRVAHEIQVLMPSQLGTGQWHHAYWRWWHLLPQQLLVAPSTKQRAYIALQLSIVEKRATATSAAMHVRGLWNVVQVLLAAAEAKGATTTAADPVAVILMLADDVTATGAPAPMLLLRHAHEGSILWRSEVLWQFVELLASVALMPWHPARSTKRPVAFKAPHLSDAFFEVICGSAIGEGAVDLVLHGCLRKVHLMIRGQRFTHDLPHEGAA
mmetsp:Transcript_90964/g.211657  ORF Transcript_90964/g.211657 Transcript_90964/m.211657 type:complete len:276 (+) Transcript_90964:219-1046(+)